MNTREVAAAMQAKNVSPSRRVHRSCVIQTDSKPSDSARCAAATTSGMVKGCSAKAMPTRDTSAPHAPCVSKRAVGTLHGLRLSNVRVGSAWVRRRSEVLY